MRHRELSDDDRARQERPRPARLPGAVGNRALARLAGEPELRGGVAHPALARAVLARQSESALPAVEPLDAFDWSSVPAADRMAYVMGLLVETYGYPENGAAGLVGNLYEESGLIPSRVEGSSSKSPMRARDAAGTLQDFTAEEIMNRQRGKSGPKLPGVGLAQWTTASRRSGLFANGSDILYDMDGQVAYLVAELGKSYKGLDARLKKAGVTVDDASDDVVYMFEIPGSILKTIEVTTAGGGTKKKQVKRDRTEPETVAVFERRRRSGHEALAAYQAAKRR